MLMITKEIFLYPTMFMIKIDLSIISHDVDDGQWFTDYQGLNKIGEV